MFLQAAYYFEPKPQEPKVPRDRFFQYYRDMHARYQLPLDEATFLQGEQHQFSELGYPIFDQCNREGHLTNLDLMVGAYWAHEFDPEFASSGPHFAHHYGFSCDMFDVLDQGSICSITALKLIDCYFKNNSFEKALLFAFDQSGIPLIEQGTIPKPSKASSAALILSKQEAGLQIRYTDIWLEKDILDLKFDFIARLEELLRQYQVNLNDLTVCVKRDTVAFKLLNLFSSQHRLFKEQVVMEYLPLIKGCVDILALIGKFDKDLGEQHKHANILILDEDVESLNIGVVLLKKAK